MILAAAPVPPSLDPTVLVFLSIFGAAGVTAIAGLVLAAWQSRRDHKRWVKEHRYNGFTRALALADRYARYRGEGDEMMARSEALEAKALAGDGEAAVEMQSLAAEMRGVVEHLSPVLEELGDVAATLEVLGPNDVLDAFNDFTDAIPGDDSEARGLAKDKFVAAVRRALAIKA
ncbi:hypothetical protein [Microbacterium maritypicum]|uniref:hypothetical protein n=1 Tax=Microbacterium maritypicum TaxID=33918 RepID=UPI0038037BD5